MPAPKNKLKQALAKGEVRYGCWLGLADPYIAEISATAGFDWVLVDGEHAPNDIRSIVAQLQVIAGTEADAAVRVPVGEPWILKQVLDIGAQTIVIPMGESGAQAAEMVSAVRYPPQGVRGVGSALVRASNFAGHTDYLTTADEEICLIMQVESKAGLEALDDILAVDGIDGVFIGPSDLAADMGYLGKAGEPAVQHAVVSAIERIAASGKSAGVLTLDPAMIEACVAAGATMVAVGIDVVTFASGMRALAGKYCSQASE